MPTPQVSFKLSELGVAPVIEGAVPGWEPLQTDAFRATAGPSLTVHRRIETANPGANPNPIPNPNPNPNPDPDPDPNLNRNQAHRDGSRARDAPALHAGACAAAAVRRP